jgi:hypothetical protein
MSCDNLCTAAKCAELEIRINALEAVVDFLMAELDAHKALDIPQAHNYEPTVKLDVNYSNATHDLNIRIQVDNAADFASTDVDPHVKSNLKLSGSFETDTLTLTVADGESQDTATIPIPIEDDHTVSVEVYDLDDGQFAIKVGVNDVFDEDSFSILLSNLKLNGSYQNEQLTLTVADGISQDTTSIAMAGINGKDGKDGKDGRDGEDGRNGHAGRDGLDALADFAKFLLALEAAKEFLKDLIREVIADLIDQLLDRLLDDLKRNLNIQLFYDNGLLTTEIAVNGAFASDSINIDMELVPIEVEQVTCTDGKPQIKTVSVAVLKGTEAAEKEAYAARAAMLKSQCELDVVAAVPEWWQSRIGSERPQLIVIYQDAAKSKWSLSLPWYKGAYGSKIIALIPNYTKGNFTTILTLADNSKVVVNATSKTAGESFIKRITPLIEPDLLRGSQLKSGGERKDSIKRAAVTPVLAKYFATGQKDMLPDWSYSFKTKKFTKYDRE